MEFSKELIQAILDYSDYIRNHPKYMHDPNEKLLNDLACVKERSPEVEALHAKLLRDHEAVLNFNQTITDELNRRYNLVQTLLTNKFLGKIIAVTSGHKNTLLCDHMTYMKVTSVVVDESSGWVKLLGPQLEIKVDKPSEEFVGYSCLAVKTSYFTTSMVGALHVRGHSSEDTIKKDLLASRIIVTDWADFSDGVKTLRNAMCQGFDTVLNKMCKQIGVNDEPGTETDTDKG